MDNNTPLTELPRLLLITDRQRMRPCFEAALESALAGGVRLVQLREKDLPDDELRNLATTAANLCSRYNAKLLINNRADIAESVSGGVHSPSNGTTPEDARRILGEDTVCGVSVHSIEEARRATEAGASYLVFGSVFETASHPGGEPAGLETLRKVVQSTSLPVFAIGGLDASRVAACREAGTYGVAVIGAVWNAADVEAATRDLLTALS